MDKQTAENTINFKDGMLTSEMGLQTVRAMQKLINKNMGPEYSELLDRKTQRYPTAQTVKDYLDNIKGPLFPETVIRAMRIVLLDFVKSAGISLAQCQLVALGGEQGKEDRRLLAPDDADSPMVGVIPKISGNSNLYLVDLPVPRNASGKKIIVVSPRLSGRGYAVGEKMSGEYSVHSSKRNEHGMAVPSSAMFGIRVKVSDMGLLKAANLPHAKIKRDDVDRLKSEENGQIFLQRALTSDGILKAMQYPKGINWDILAEYE